jgi:predicted ATPase
MITLITGYVLPDWEEDYMNIITSKYNKLGVQIYDTFYDISKQYVQYTFQSIEYSYLKEKQTTLLHLPEYNLHPSYQSKLIKDFVDWSVTNEVDLHIFTHSDHILRALQISVIENRIKSSEIKIFFYNTVESSIEIILNGQGEIENWEFGFFDQSNKDFKIMFGF